MKEKEEAWEKEKRDLLEELRTKWAPDEEEDEETRLPESRAEFVAKVKDLKADSFDMGIAGFELALRQLRIVNPDLNVTGVGLNSQIVDGKLVPGVEDEEEEN